MFLRVKPQPVHLTLSRSFGSQKTLQTSLEHDEVKDDDSSSSSAQTEAIVRQARQTFGETLPGNFLSKEEYQVYERLYGPPSATTLPEDVQMLKDFEGEEDDMVDTADTTKPDVLMRQNRDGSLEEVTFEEGAESETEQANDGGAIFESISHDEPPIEFSDEDIIKELGRVGKQTGAAEEDMFVPVDPESETIFQNRMEALHDQLAANRADHEAAEMVKESSRKEESLQEPEEELLDIEDEVDDGIESEVNEYEQSNIVRAHPLTSAGHFGTSPSTIQLPKDTLVDPITALLADASNKHLAEVALKTFGGPGLPHSTATMRRPHLVQQTIPLEASQGRMGEMESNAYLASIYSGAYASTMSALVEVRKRLGSDWLRGLMSQSGGPRILDAGSGGAAVLAWREIIRAESEAIHHSIPPATGRLPFGKSTVVTGSPTLRHRASALLDDTTFISRLPDYNPLRDHPSLEASNPQPRKQYDIIIAPYTLWSLKEDHMRKSQIQNFWSLLDPHGGVLILIEKGVPRGFELIAGARDTLLKHHISSPGSEQVVEDSAESVHPNRFTFKEEGMIIAPCTNHGKCPMYITAGKSQGRKDFCHFTQRFIRPSYLQQILGAKDKNHEDISFSYVALRRGNDLRKSQSIPQGKLAADAAFEGYEEYDAEDRNSDGKAPLHPLSMPRAILPPIKRRGHVILDLCTPAGKIERWTVPKSFSKQAYRDARKSKWGDLWALGAKTRVERNVRVGMKKQQQRESGREEETQRDTVDEPEAEGDDEIGGITEDGGRGRGSGKHPGAKKGRTRKSEEVPKARKGRSGKAKYPQVKET